MATPPNGPIEVVFCFDTTGSMNSVIQVVKDRVTELTERLLADIAGIRIGILAHGDYGDEPYLLQRLDLTSDGTELRQFVSNVRGTCGGDAPECYELALHEVRTNFSWTPDSRKRLVIIGDDEPHDIKSPRNQRKIDWRRETEQLRDELHLVIYSVQAKGRSSAAWFWKGMAEITGGKHLELSNFASIFDFLMAICYLEHGVEFFEAYGQEVHSRPGGAGSGDVSAMLSRLERSTSEGAPAPVTAAAAAAAAAPPSATTAASSRGSSSSSRARGKTDRLRTTKRATPMKAKTASATSVVAAAKTKRLRRAAAKALSPRAKRESEPFCGETIVVNGRWSPWHVLASPTTPTSATSDGGWRRFGEGVIRNRIAVPSAPTTGVDRKRVLVELSVSRDACAPHRPADAAKTTLYSRILCEGATNAVASLLRGNRLLKWHVHRSVTRGLHVLLRFATIDSEGRSLQQQRHQLRKSNSYAWNSGRVVSGAQRQLLSVPAPRARQMAKFLRSLADLSRPAAILET